jgi:hypothetical protein
MSELPDLHNSSDVSDEGGRWNKSLKASKPRKLLMPLMPSAPRGIRPHGPREVCLVHNKST